MFKHLTIVLSGISILALIAEVLILTFAGISYLEIAYTLSYFVIVFAGAFIGISGGLRTGIKTSFGAAVYSFGIANLLLLLGILFVDYFTYISDTYISYPSIGDLFFLMTVPAIAVGLGFILKIYKVHASMKVFTKIISLVFVATLIVLYVLGFPSIRPDYFGADITDLMYTLADIILLSLVLIMAFVSHKQTYHGLKIYLAGILLSVLGDFLFVQRVGSGTYSGFADPSEIVYMFAALGIVVGILTMKENFRNRVQDLPKN